MKNPLGRYAAGALALGAVAGGAAFGFPSASETWQPVTYGLHATPAQLLPATVSTAHPVRVVSTRLDGQGRPVVTTRTATDKATAANDIRSAQQAENAVGVELDATMAATDVAGTDPLRGQQWDFAKISVADAWKKSTGAGVTVAVIDTGVDATHPDLAGQVLPEYDVINKTTVAVSTDPNGHGSHVAGTIAADTGNGIGISGVAPNAKILPIRVLGANGSGYMSDAATGIVYAADHGATVINMSLGSSSQVTAVTNAIAYARSKGVTVVAAAGNERQSGSPTSYPAADAGVIAVAATDSNDAVASYSNAGSYVDVAAPGSSILSTTGGTYQFWNGTSMASPHVAAIAALVKAANPALTPDQIEKAIETSAVDLGTKGKDNDYGYGRVNAAAALAAAAPASPAPSGATPSGPVTSGPTSSPTAGPTSSPTSSPGPARTTEPAPSPSKTVSPTPTPSTTVTPTPVRTTTAPPAPKVRPSIAITPTSQTVVAGATATTAFLVTGAGGKPWAGQPVQICLAPAGAAFGCTSGRTGTDGRIVASVRATGSFQLKLTALATDASEAVTSAVANVTVRAQLTMTRTAPGTLAVSMAGAAGQTVLVQRLDGSRWVSVGSYRAEASRQLTGLAAGRSYRLVVASTAAVVGVTTDSVQA